MPELPEVETSRRGIEPHIIGTRVERVIVRNRSLRWPVSETLDRNLLGETITSVTRRAKYLLINTDGGSAILHLGMSGSVYIVDRDTPAGIHDHVDIDFDSGKTMRFRDPRRFGSLHWSKAPLQHKLLKSLGPEPLVNDFDARYLWEKSRGRRVSVKQFIMNAQVVVGVGNIYASESLHRAGIHPNRAAGKVSLPRYQALVSQVKDVLGEAIESGGSTLRDYVNGSGSPGYFQQKLLVYGRTGEECAACSKSIRQIKIGQRSSFYCPHCQK